jgi:hypothetical protein
MFFGTTPQISSSCLLKEGMVPGEKSPFPGPMGEHFWAEPACFFPSLYVYGNGEKLTAGMNPKKVEGGVFEIEEGRFNP